MLMTLNILLLALGIEFKKSAVHLCALFHNKLRHGMFHGWPYFDGHAYSFPSLTDAALFWEEILILLVPLKHGRHWEEMI